MKTLNHISDILDKMLTAAACVYLMYMFFACVVQVFSRYVLGNSFGWTEETARFAFASMGMLGIPVALHKGMHVSIDIFESKLKGRMLLIQKLFVLALIFLISAIILVQGLDFVLRMDGIYSPAVRIPMTAIYCTVPICGLTCMWFISIEALNIILFQHKGGDA